LISNPHVLSQAIGAWLGIPTSEVLTGQAMQAMSDEQLADHVGACNIYARATPEHKLRIVRALQGRYKLVCAMTGACVRCCLQAAAASHPQWRHHLAGTSATSLCGD
jgi:hypothetical protein